MIVVDTSVLAAIAFDEIERDPFMERILKSNRDLISAGMKRSGFKIAAIIDEPPPHRPDLTQPTNR